MQPMANIALRAARLGARVLLNYIERRHQIKVELKDGQEEVSEVDRRAEQAISEALREAYPDHAIIGEEFGGDPGSSEYVWYIDPLDGTVNYLAGIPHFCVSVGVLHRGVPAHGAIIDPIRGEEFHASRGHGAYLNNRRLRVSANERLAQSVLATGSPHFRIKHHWPSYLKIHAHIGRNSRSERRSGSAALDLAYVAAGRIDGYWQLGLKPFDIAAGVVMVREAGGMVADIAGGERFLETGNVIASNNHLLKPMLQCVRPNLSDALREG
ncbi:MAG: inositol monophosphatase family protein [Gammaproteobacteria bacterium]|nr:inositol monophosphatase family protein [Gammaproteobacteria bacterium]MCY4323750.1 inositol monophosphatase family protein [Gammaproteobacteria bacterium]